MSTKIPENFYAVEYLVGEFEKKTAASNNTETVPFWVCYETKDITKAYKYVQEQRLLDAINSRSLRVLKKSTSIQYDIV